MTEDEAISRLQVQHDAVDRLFDDVRFGASFQSWQRFTSTVLAQIFLPNSPHHQEFTALSFRNNFAISGDDSTLDERTYRKGLIAAKTLLAGMIQEIRAFGLPAGLAGSTEAAPGGRDAEALVESLCRRFPAFARRLQRRRGGRPGYAIQDEYDVQTLMHGLLTLHFDDIRPEESTPSIAGGSARIDFLLKAEGIGLEIKMTREDLRDNKTGGEFLIDIGRYPAHPDVRLVIYFVYDPEGHISNPAGFAADVERKFGGHQARVIVAGPYA